MVNKYSMDPDQTPDFLPPNWTRERVSGRLMFVSPNGTKHFNRMSRVLKYLEGVQQINKGKQPEGSEKILPPLPTYSRFRTESTRTQGTPRARESASQNVQFVHANEAKRRRPRNERQEVEYNGQYVLALEAKPRPLPVPPPIDPLSEDELARIYNRAMNIGYPRLPENLQFPPGPGMVTNWHVAPPGTGTRVVFPQRALMVSDRRNMNFNLAEQGIALCRGQMLRTKYSVHGGPGRARDIKTLKPHQTKAVCLISKPNVHGILLYYGMGTGKTITSIACIDHLHYRAGLSFSRVIVLVPSSVVEQFKKQYLALELGPISEVVIGTHDSFKKMSDRDLVEYASNSLLIVDEVHRLRNGLGILSEKIMKAARLAKKVIFMTGTPCYNWPSDISPLIHALKHGSLPPSPKDFDKLFGKPGLNRPGLLRSALRCCVLYHVTEEGFPAIETFDEICLMTTEQEKIHKLMTVPKSLSEEELDTVSAEDEARNEKQAENGGGDDTEISIAYLTFPRQICNAVYFYGGKPQNPRPGFRWISMPDSWYYSPKMEKIISRVKEKAETNARSIVYTHFKTAYGIDILSHLLESNSNGEPLVSGIDFDVVKGGMVPASIKRIVDKYNSRDDRLRVLLLTDMAAEGLDLKETEFVHVVEPQFNMPIVDQVIGRARRFLSHVNLPLHRQLVTVYKYYSVLPNSPADILDTPIDKKMKGVLYKYGADVCIRDLCNRKKSMCDEFLNVVKEVAYQNESFC